MNPYTIPGLHNKDVLDLLFAIQDVTGVDAITLKSPLKTHRAAMSRQIFSYIAKQKGYKQHQIAPHIGRKRANVSSSIKKCEIMIANNTNYKHTFNQVCEKLNLRENKHV